MHAPYAAQYCVIGGSGAGSGGSFTLDAAATWAAPAAAVSELPLSALVAGAADAVVFAVFAVFALAVVIAAGVLAALAALAADAPVAVAAVATGALAPGAVAAAGMLALIGAAEKLLGGKGGRDGVLVDEVGVPTGWRGGICG